MKKNLLLAVAAIGFLASQPASAQYYLNSSIGANQNPGGLNTDIEEPSGIVGWTTILTGTAATATTPIWSPVQTVPFTFQFNGAAVSSFKVSSSGVLTFTTSATAVPSGTNLALPAATIPDKSICVWGLACTASNDFIKTKTFGTAPNQQHWIQFTSASESGNTNTAYTYWAIVLEETSNKIYIVDQRAGLNAATPNLTLTVGVQVSSTVAVQTATSPRQASNTYLTDDDTPADNSFYLFGPGSRPANDLEALTLTIPTIASRQAPISVTGTFENLGGQTATSYTVNYQVNNGTTVSGAVTTANVASLRNGSFTHPTPWQPSHNGYYNLKVWLSAPNGGVDADPSNDTLRTAVAVGDSTMRRLVVEECFTSATCPPCNPGNINVENINRLNPNKQVVIKYQQNFPAPGNDPYYTAEGGARRDYYGINAIPYMMLDGGWNENSQSFTTAILNQYEAKPALMRISGTYTLSGTTVTASAQIRPFLDIPTDRMVTQMVITERRTVNNHRTNGETQFFQVMKKMLPDENGTGMPALSSGQSFSLNQSFDVSTLATSEAVEHFDSLRVVVFVQDTTTNQVYQGAYLTLARPTATRSSQLGTAFNLVPNPSTGATTLLVNLERPETVRVEVLDLLGRQIFVRPQVSLGSGAQSVPLTLTNQAAGLYTVRLTTSAGVRSSKLTLE